MNDLFSDPEYITNENGTRYIREDLAEVKTQGVTETTFSAFWSDAPHKIGKAQAEKAWKKLGRHARASAHEAVKDWYAWFHKAYPTASPLHPSTYLNQRRWEDEGWKPQEKRGPDEKMLTFWADFINGDERMHGAKPSDGLVRELLRRKLVSPQRMQDRLQP